MKKTTLFTMLICVMTLSWVSIAAAALSTITGNHVYFNVANDEGARFGSGVTDSYYILAAGGGLNQLHITTSVSNVYGEVTTKSTDSSSYSGTFYITTTGGRGYNDDIILLASVKGPISNDFSLSVKSSGYQWTPNTTGYLTDVVNYSYVDGAVNQTFTKTDFLYGPQTTKPGPIQENGGILPLYYGQDTTDQNTAEYLMFIDLNVGNFLNSKDANATDKGDVKVEFNFTGLYSTASFNTYAWCLASIVGGGTVDWTNRTNSTKGITQASGYTINSTAQAPVPIPAAFWLLGSGFSGMFFIRRRKTLA